MDTDTTTILSITNWTGSKASNNPDGGVSSLEGWLSNKAKRPIQASQRQGDVLQIQILAKDKRSFLHCDGWRWAGVDIKITEGQLDSVPPSSRNSSVSIPSGPRGGGFGSDSRNGSLSSRITGGPTNSFNNQNRNQSKELFDNAPSGPRNGSFSQNRQPNGQASNNTFGSQNRITPQEAPTPALSATLEQVIRNRYDPNSKLLDLSALAMDPLIQAADLQSASAEKVFGALFITLEKSVFETREKRAEMIESVSFKNNSLSSVKEIIGAGTTFYSVKNLDLSDNNFQKITDLTWWKNRFPGLEQIILAGNPVDSSQTREDVKKWYRKLKTYNLQPLDAPFVGTLQPPQPAAMPPVPTSSPAPGAGPNGQLLDTTNHPEFPQGSTFGQPTIGKTEDLLMMEQMGLKFSYETGLKMQWVQECLKANNWDYDKAINDLKLTVQNGSLPQEAFITV
ncbi:nuclear mRNA export, poly(A)+RNA binding protein [Knufia obscura]|nr:nuclear mRNA export, poly(A)+RNA binding protein [Knufia obscura]